MNLPICHYLLPNKQESATEPAWNTFPADCAHIKLMAGNNPPLSATCSASIRHHAA